MDLQQLKAEYDKLQGKYGAKNLNSVHFGGCTDNPDFCFVFMHPTKRNLASSKEWKGEKYPWIGTRDVWKLFHKVHLLNSDLYCKTQTYKAEEWTEAFAEEIYGEMKKHRCFLTNLAKCTQADASALPNSVYKTYLPLFDQEICLVRPKVTFLLGNQVSSLVLNRKISVSQCRKQLFTKQIQGEKYSFYAVYYPVGNGRMHMEQAAEDIGWIMQEHMRN